VNGRYFWLFTFFMPALISGATFMLLAIFFHQLIRAPLFSAPHGKSSTAVFFLRGTLDENGNTITQSGDGAIMNATIRTNVKKP
jgi:hypothetical protein